MLHSANQNILQCNREIEKRVRHTLPDFYFFSSHEDTILWIFVVFSAFADINMELIFHVRFLL